MLIFTQILRKLIRYVSMESYLFNGQCMAGLLPRETAQHLLRSRPTFFVSSCKAPYHIFLNHRTHKWRMRSYSHLKTVNRLKYLLTQLSIHIVYVWMWAVTHNVFSGVRFNTDSFRVWLYAPRGPCDVLRDSSQIWIN